MERLKDAGALLVQDADTGIAYHDLKSFSPALERQFNASIVGKFYGVIQQMANKLLDAGRIAQHGGGQRGILLHRQAKSLGLSLLALCRERPVYHIAQAELSFVEFQTTGTQR